MNTENTNSEDLVKINVLCHLGNSNLMDPKETVEIIITQIGIESEYNYFKYLHGEVGKNIKNIIYGCINSPDNKIIKDWMENENTAEGVRKLVSAAKEFKIELIEV